MYYHWNKLCFKIYFGDQLYLLLKMPNKKHLAKYALINSLKSCNPETRVHIISFLNDKGIEALSESVYNTIFNDLCLSKAEKKKLRKSYKEKEKIFQAIGKKNNSIKRRRTLLIQHGGSLGLLLSIAANLLSGLIFGHQ